MSACNHSGLNADKTLVSLKLRAPEPQLPMTQQMTQNSVIIIFPQTTFSQQALG